MPCQRAKSDMTPCYVRDGKLAATIATIGFGGARTVCVGCEVATGLLREERQAAVAATRPDTGQDTA